MALSRSGCLSCPSSVTSVGTICSSLTPYRQRSQLGSAIVGFYRTPPPLVSNKALFLGAQPREKSPLLSAAAVCCPLIPAFFLVLGSLMCLWIFPRNHAWGEAPDRSSDVSILHCHRPFPSNSIVFPALQIHSTRAVTFSSSKQLTTSVASSYHFLDPST